MNDNGMGGRRIGKRYFSSGHHLTPGDSINIEEDSDYYSTAPNSGNLSDWDKLLADYYKDKKFIKSQKRKWLPPKQKR